MTHIDFYLLGNNGVDSSDHIACRLTDKAFRMGHRVYLYSDDATVCQKLDQMLWTFSAASFVPHAQYSDNISPDTPVSIGSNEPPAGFTDVLISLSEQVPAFFSRFDRVAEIVGSLDSEKQQARERFRYYRDRGYELQTHEL